MLSFVDVGAVALLGSAMLLFADESARADVTAVDGSAYGYFCVVSAFSLAARRRVRRRWLQRLEQPPDRSQENFTARRLAGTSAALETYELVVYRRRPYNYALKSEGKRPWYQKETHHPSDRQLLSELRGQNFEELRSRWRVEADPRWESLPTIFVAPGRASRPLSKERS